MKENEKKGRRFKEELMHVREGKEKKDGITPNKNTRTRVTPGGRGGDTCRELEIICYPLARIRTPLRKRVRDVFEKIFWTIRRMEV